jgi:N-acetylglucosamine kinase-like BadF-type ATPase
MILAVDGGASKTVARVMDEEERRIRGPRIAGPTNLTSWPADGVRTNLLDAGNEAGRDAEVEISGLRGGVFGIAGIGGSEDVTQSGTELIQRAMG